MLPAVLFLILASTAYANCPNGTFYEAYFNKCYKVNIQFLGFLAAEQSCINLGGNLVSVQSIVENAYVSGIATASTPATSFWIGANYLMGPQWSWTTGASVNFTIWAPSQPSDPSANQCAAVREQDNAWTKEQCYSQRPSVCQIDPSASSSPAPTPCPTLSPSPCPTGNTSCPANAVCSTGYTFYIGTCKCYKTFNVTTSFTNAQEYCARENGVLPKIPDSSTNDFIYTLVNYQFPWVWTGLNCPSGIDSCQWMDGTPLGSFRPFEDSLSAPLYYLVTASAPNARIWNRSSTVDSNYIVCQKDPTTTTALLAAMESQSSQQHRISPRKRDSDKLILIQN